MIRYECASCGAKLETDDSLSGKQEPCPACRKLNTVPLSKRDLAKQRRRAKDAVEEPQEQQGQTPRDGRAMGTGKKLAYLGGLAVAFVLGVLCVWVMKSSQGPVARPDPPEQASKPDRPLQDGNGKQGELSRAERRRQEEAERKEKQKQEEAAREEKQKQEEAAREEKQKEEAAREEARKKEEAETWKQNEAKQGARKRLIDKAVSTGAFTKVDLRGGGATIWVDSSFYLADFETKGRLTGVVYAYIATQARNHWVVVLLKDSRSGKTVGTHGISGLKME